MDSRDTREELVIELQKLQKENNSLKKSCHSISKLETTQKALLASEIRYRSLFESAKDGILILDAETGRIDDVNPFLINLLGFSYDQLTEKSIWEIGVFKDIISNKVKFLELKEIGYVRYTDLPLKAKDGRVIHVEFVSNVYISDNQNVIQCNIRDISARIAIEKDLIEAKEKAEESNRLKSAFLANMSHEIRTPMNGILGFADLLKSPDITGEQQQEYVRIIEKSGLRMLNIINDIVSISKIEAGLMEVNLTKSNINEQIEYIYNFFLPEIEGKGMQFLIKYSLPMSKAIIKTDREKLFAILTNLVKNAIKYSEKGSIELGYNKNGKYIEFYVKDSGIGIDIDRQKAIFERFIQADISDVHAYQGAGLGLSISRAYVKMLGGKLWVESLKGKGSTFYFTIPYNAEQQNTIEDTTNTIEGKVKPQITNLKILIVDDDKTSDLLLTILISELSNGILHAKNGLEAVTLCRDNPNLDLIFMDIKMPILDGYEATRQIRQFNNDVVIIAQTAYALLGEKEKALEAGCNEYIPKPIERVNLLSILQQYFTR